MNDDVVVIVRLVTGDDVIAIIHGELDDKVRLAHPYFIKYILSKGTVGMMPYCSLSDEIFYEIARSRIEFVVVANDEISGKFIRMINSPEQLYTTTEASLNESSAEPETSVSEYYLQGNTTKH